MYILKKNIMKKCGNFSKFMQYNEFVRGFHRNSFRRPLGRRDERNTKQTHVCDPTVYIQDQKKGISLFVYDL